MSITITSTDRLLANADRIIADYKHAHALYFATYDDLTHDDIALYHSAVASLWGIADWITEHGTTEQASFIAKEAKNFDKVWVEEYNPYMKEVVGYWKDK